MRNTKLFLCGIFLMLAVGCVRNTHPILKDEQVTTNDALLGKWVSTDGKTSLELKPGQEHQYKLNYVNQDGKTGDFLVRLGKIGDVDVAELSADVFNAKTGDEYKSLLLPLYSLIVIEKVAPTQVVLNGVRVEWLEKYCKANPDELDVTKVGEQDDLVNSSTEEFQAFFTRHVKDVGMLGKGETFVHPGDPTTQPAK